MSFPLLNLPFELILEVADHLDTATVLNLARTCSSLHQILVRNSYIHKHHLRSGNPIKFLEVIESQDLATAERFLQVGADPNQTMHRPCILYSERLNQPITQAILTGSLPMVRLLLQHGGDPMLQCLNSRLKNRNDWFSTPLGIAMQSRQQEIACFLINHLDPNFDINKAIVDKCANKWETTALQQACRYSLPQALEELIHRGANIHTPLKDSSAEEQLLQFAADNNSGTQSLPYSRGGVRNPFDIPIGILPTLSRYTPPNSDDLHAFNTAVQYHELSAVLGTIKVLMDHGADPFQFPWSSSDREFKRCVWTWAAECLAVSCPVGGVFAAMKPPSGWVDRKGERVPRGWD